MFRINLKKLRENKHISQATLARALGVRQSTVAMWESGKNYPEFKTLEKIATYFDVSTDYLIGRTSTAHSINYLSRLCELRKINGLTQQELAKELGISQSTLSTWESGRYEPDSASLLKLAQYFNVSVDYLLGREESTKKEPAANAGGELSGIDAELYELLMGLPEDKLQDAMRYVRYLKSLPDNE